MLSMGFNQATVLHDLAPASPDIDASVALLGGVFNAAIAVVDYLIDDSLQAPQHVFEAISRSLVQNIFGSTPLAIAALATAYEFVTDPRLRLLIVLVATCANQGLFIYQYSHNEEAWLALGRTIGALFSAQQA